MGIFAPSLRKKSTMGILKKCLLICTSLSFQNQKHLKDCQSTRAGRKKKLLILLRKLDFQNTDLVSRTTTSPAVSSPTSPLQPFRKSEFTNSKTSSESQPHSEI